MIYDATMPSSVTVYFDATRHPPSTFQPHSVDMHSGQEPRHSLHTFIAAPSANLGAPVYLPEKKIKERRQRVTMVVDEHMGLTIMARYATLR